jgi:hypothetical protein
MKIKSNKKMRIRTNFTVQEWPKLTVHRKDKVESAQKKDKVGSKGSRRRRVPVGVSLALGQSAALLSSGE